MNVLVVAANLAVIAAIVGFAHIVGWAGPSFAAGFIAGALMFLMWFRLKYGYWP